MTVFDLQTDPAGREGLARLAPGVHAVYRDLDAAVARLSPACALSGRCCRFEEYDHTLFLSSVEAEVLLAEAPPPSRPLDGGATCPWQDARGLCTARDARPLGCRVYFCDPAYQPHAPGLSEAFLGRLKRLVDDAGLSWGYAPLHRHLAVARDDGRYPPATRDEPPADPSGTPTGTASAFLT